jgi:predicted Zn-dependent protease
MSCRPAVLLPRLLLLLALTAAASLPACITDPVTGEKSFGFDMSDSEEVAMGNQYASSFKAQYEGAYPDAEMQRHCERIVLGMAKRSHRPTLPWNFTILNSSEVNAFALPGGTVCITRGLLYQLENEVAFAGVMGHEIGHVTHKHSVKSMSQGMLFQILVAGAAIGASESDSEWAEVGVALGAVGGQLLLLSYSRSHESESDERGVEYSYEAGYDPRELASVFRLFQELKGGQEPPVWLSTHPLDADRIKSVKREVKRRYPEVDRTNGAGLKKTSPEWERLVAGRLREHQKVYDEYDRVGKTFARAVKNEDRAALSGVLQALERCQSQLPGHALFTSGIGVVLHAMGQSGKAKGYFRRAASQQSDLFEPHLYLAQIAYDEGDTETVHREGKRAEQLFPLHPRAAYLRARAYDARGQYPNAGKKYEHVLQLAPEGSEEHSYSAQRIQAFRAQGIIW